VRHLQNELEELRRANAAVLGSNAKLRAENEALKVKLEATEQQLDQVEKDREDALHQLQHTRNEAQRLEEAAKRRLEQYGKNYGDSWPGDKDKDKRRTSFDSPLQSCDLGNSPVHQHGDTPDSGVCRTSREHHDKILKANGCINEETHNRKVEEQWTDLRSKHCEQFQQILHRLSEELTTEDSSERQFLRRIEASMRDKFIDFNRNIDP